MLATALGWGGTLGTLGAYLMLTRGRLEATSVTYALMNVVGGLLAGIASAAFGAWPSATTNLIWAAISVRTLMESPHGRRLMAVASQRLGQLRQQWRVQAIELPSPFEQVSVEVAVPTADAA